VPGKAVVEERRKRIAELLMQLRKELMMPIESGEEAKKLNDYAHMIGALVEELEEELDIGVVLKKRGGGRRR